MRLLADENIPRAAVEKLRDDGHDVVWIREVSPGISDDTVAELAATQRRVLVTFDKDFGELVIGGQGQQPAGLVLFRTSMGSPDTIAVTISTTLASRDDWSGHIAVVGDARIRMRRLPGPSAPE